MSSYLLGVVHKFASDAKHSWFDDGVVEEETVERPVDTVVYIIHDRLATFSFGNGSIHRELVNRGGLLLDHPLAGDVHTKVEGTGSVVPSSCKKKKK